MNTYSKNRVQDAIVDVSKGPFCFGPDVSFDNCSIKLGASQRDAVLIDGNFNNCQITANKRIAGYRFHDFSFNHCIFTGKYSGCDFGYWTGISRKKTSVCDCDFSNTELDGCRFRNTDINKIKLPGWPYFAFRPIDFHRDAMNVTWPGKLAAWVGVFETESEETSFVIESSLSVLRRFGSSEDVLIGLLRECGISI